MYRSRDCSTCLLWVRCSDERNPVFCVFSTPMNEWMNTLTLHKHYIKIVYDRPVAYGLSSSQMRSKRHEPLSGISRFPFNLTAKKQHPLCIKTRLFELKKPFLRLLSPVGNWTPLPTLHPFGAFNSTRAFFGARRRCLSPPASPFAPPATPSGSALS